MKRILVKRRMVSLAGAIALAVYEGSGILAIMAGRELLLYEESERGEFELEERARKGFLLMHLGDLIQERVVEEHH